MDVSWPIMCTNCDPRLPTPRRSRSTLAMSTSATSISWCRKGSIRTGRISSGRPSATSSNATQTSSGNPRPEEPGPRAANYTREDLEAARRAGEMLHINVLGLATIAQDVTPELARATIASVSVLGALHATSAVKAALADRMR